MDKEKTTTFVSEIFVSDAKINTARDARRRIHLKFLWFNIDHKIRIVKTASIITNSSVIPSPVKECTDESPKTPDRVKKVVLSESKPQDFEKSEELVITGIAHPDSDTFKATHMLMKCPSKYKDNQEIGSK